MNHVPSKWVANRSKWLPPAMVRRHCVRVFSLAVGCLWTGAGSSSVVVCNVVVRWSRCTGQQQPRQWKQQQTVSAAAAAVEATAIAAAAVAVAAVAVAAVAALFQLVPVVWCAYGVPGDRFPLIWTDEYYPPIPRHVMSCVYVCVRMCVYPLQARKKKILNLTGSILNLNTHDLRSGCFSCDCILCLLLLLSPSYHNTNSAAV